jgi:hypothetical protein
MYIKLVMTLLISVLGLGLAACGGGGSGMNANTSCQEDDGSPCAPPTPPSSCPFPNVTAPALLSPANQSVVAVTGQSQIRILIGDTSAAPYASGSFIAVLSVSDSPDDISTGLVGAFAASSAFTAVSVAPGAVTESAIVRLPNIAIGPGIQYFVYMQITGAGCAVAGPIGTFTTS